MNMKKITLALFGVLVASTAAAKGFDCKVLPGNYVGWREPGRSEVALKADIKGNTVEAVLHLLPNDGSEVLYIRPVSKKLEIKVNTIRRFLAGAYEVGTGEDGNDVTLAELDLKKDRRTEAWKGVIYDDGVIFDLDCVRQ